MGECSLPIILPCARETAATGRAAWRERWSVEASRPYSSSSSHVHMIFVSSREDRFPVAISRKPPFSPLPDRRDSGRRAQLMLLFFTPCGTNRPKQIAFYGRGVIFLSRLTPHERKGIHRHVPPCGVSRISNRSVSLAHARHAVPACIRRAGAAAALCGTGVLAYPVALCRPGAVRPPTPGTQTARRRGLVWQGGDGTA